MNRALVYSTFFSFLEDIDIDEFNIFWEIVHMGMINVSPSCSIYFIEMKRLLLTGEIDRPSTERVEPVRGCLITQAVWNEPP
jgi:hypothetical protein